MEGCTFFTTIDLRKFQKIQGKFLLISLFSFLPLPLSCVVPKSGDGTRGLEAWQIGGISPPYARRRAAGFPIRICLLPLLCWIGVRGNVAYTVCVRVLRGATRVALVIAGASTRP